MTHSCPGRVSPPGDRAGSVLLAIETAGASCSAALARDGAILAAECRPQRHGHAEALFPMIERLTAEAGLTPSQIDRVAVCVGPGGFTGIRVGLAAAHGIVLARKAQLVGVTGFAAVVAALTESRRQGGVLLVALDSRRDEFYVQLFALDSAAALAEPAAVLPDRLPGYVSRLAGNTVLLAAGDAAEAAGAALLGRPGVTVISGSAPDARGVVAAAQRQLHAASSPDAVRPLYLRPPDVTLPKRQPQPVPVRR